MVKKFLYASLGLAPVAIGISFAGTGGLVIFTVAAAALLPLAWLIGESTEQAAYHTGPGIGGFLNATFGNAPELIIALFAVSHGLPDVVRGSLAGSVVGNMLLVLGFSLAVGGRGQLDRRSSLVSLGLVAVTALVLLIPAGPGWSGDPDRAALAALSLPVAVVLLLAYIAVTSFALRRHHDLHRGTAVNERAWPLHVSLSVLAIATVITAWVAEILVGSIEEFAEHAGLSEFFVAAVIIAIVGNAAEHGGAVVVAAHGKLKLAAEIALASSAQVAVFLIPAVAILSWAIDPLALSFRPVEIAVMGGTAAFCSVVLFGGHSSRGRGILLLAGYAAVAAAFFIVGDR